MSTILFSAKGPTMGACLDASVMVILHPRLDHIREGMETKCRSHSAKLSKASVSRLTSLVSNNLALDYSESTALKVELAI